MTKGNHHVFWTQMGSVHMNSQQLWEHVQELCSPGPNQSMVRGGGYKTLSMAFGTGNVGFLQV